MMSEFSDAFESFRRDFESIRKSRESLHHEFEKLYLDPCTKEVNPGDRVVIAVGLLNRGHPWIREEGIVQEVGSVSVKVRFKMNYDSEYTEVWIHPALICDVLE